MTTASEVTSSAAQAPGSPLRIPLPTDELLGRRLADAEAELTELIADACGGDQCIGLRIEPRGSIDPGGRSGCETFVVSVPGTVAEGAEQAIPVLYVPRGGTITLVVEMSCDEGPPSSPSSTEPTPTPQETATTSSGGSPSPTSTSGP